MLGIDVYSAEALVPSVIGVLAMASVMVWAFIKVRRLMRDGEPR